MLRINDQYCSKSCQNEDLYSTDYSPTPLPDLREGNCVGLAGKSFFPLGSTAVHVKRMCGTCPVAQECGEYAVKVAVEGVWAGTNWEERERIRADKGIVAEPMTFDYILQTQFRRREVEDGEPSPVRS